MKTIKSIKLSNISEIYVGLNRNCRCGCGGNYIATSYHKTKSNLSNDIEAQNKLNLAKELALKKDSEIDYEDTYINIGYGNNQAITIYLDDIK
jgi:hypothetical protein